MLRGTPQTPLNARVHAASSTCKRRWLTITQKKVRPGSRPAQCDAGDANTSSLGASQCGSQGVYSAYCDMESYTLGLVALPYAGAWPALDHADGVVKRAGHRAEALGRRLVGRNTTKRQTNEKERHCRWHTAEHDKCRHD